MTDRLDRDATRSAVPPQNIPVGWLIENYQREFGIDIRPYVPPSTPELESYVDRDGVIRFRPLVVGDAAFYEQLATFSWYYQPYKAEYGTASRITAGRRVMEIGAGSGAFAEHSGAAEYRGIELSADAVDAAQRRRINVRLLPVEELHLGPHEKPFDVVCAFQVLEHVVDPESFLSTIRAICDDDGWVVVSVPARDSFVGLASNNLLNMPPHHQSWWDAGAIENVARRAGLSVRAVVHEDLDSIHTEWARTTMLTYDGSSSLGRRPMRARVAGRLRSVLGPHLFPHIDDVVYRCFKGHTMTALMQPSGARVASHAGASEQDGAEPDHFREQNGSGGSRGATSGPSSRLADGLDR